MSNDDFGAPASATGIEWEGLKGSLLLVTPKEAIAEIETQFGTTSAVQADVVVLDGDKAGEEYLDTLIFPKMIQSQVKPRIGKGMVLGRLGQGTAKPKQSKPWLLAEATEADKTVARAYVATKVDAPF